MSYDLIFRSDPNTEAIDVLQRYAGLLESFHRACHSIPYRMLKGAWIERTAGHSCRIRGRDPRVGGSIRISRSSTSPSTPRAPLSSMRGVPPAGCSHRCAPPRIALQTPGGVLRATRGRWPYEEIIRRGFLRRLMPQPFGGEGTVRLSTSRSWLRVPMRSTAMSSLTLFANLLEQYVN